MYDEFCCHFFATLYISPYFYYCVILYILLSFIFTIYNIYYTFHYFVLTIYIYLYTLLIYCHTIFLFFYFIFVLSSLPFPFLLKLLSPLYYYWFYHFTTTILFTFEAVCLLALEMHTHSAISVSMRIGAWLKLNRYQKSIQRTIALLFFHLLHLHLRERKKFRDYNQCVKACLFC